MTDLRAALLALVAPLSRGDEILPGIRLLRTSAETGMRLVFELNAFELKADQAEEIEVEVAPAEGNAPAAAATPRLRFAYTARGPLGRQRGLSICRAVAERAAENEELVLAELAREAESMPTASRIREVRVTHLLEEAVDGPRRFHTLSPYVGCVIGCRFCYAQSHVAVARRLSGLPAVAWGSYVDVRVNAPEVLAAELRAEDVAVIKFCPIVSDPYQAVEERHGVTQACLEVIARTERPPAVLVLTRSRLIMRDAALLGAMGAYVGMSIPTADDESRAHFEPRAASVKERFEVLRALRAAGARTFAVVQPMLPGPIEALADGLAEHCASVSIDVLQSVEGAAEDFADPRYQHAATAEWQRAQAEGLARALEARGVAVWRGELPPDITAARPRS